MNYLDPPPMPAPVVVEKDVGGLVSEYQARTEQYRLEGREVRLHECRSACTLALSLPNVCVYPHSILKFHKAYDWNTKIRDEAVSAELMAAYPENVRVRLGALTQDYKVLTGAELIELGVRDCTARPDVQIARAPAPRPRSAPADAPNVAGVFGTILAALHIGAPAGSLPPRSVARAPEAVRKIPDVDDTGAAYPPPPPRRPLEIDLAIADVEADATPLPPRRPAGIDPAPGLPRLIEGAQPTLPWGVLSYSSFGR